LSDFAIIDLNQKILIFQLSFMASMPFHILGTLQAGKAVKVA